VQWGLGRLANASREIRDNGPDVNGETVLLGQFSSKGMRVDKFA